MRKRKLLKLGLVGGLMCSLAIQAQKGSWVEFGLTGSGGAGIITNKNLWNDQRTVTADVSFLYTYGAKLALNINEAHEILLNAEMGIRKQKYTIKIDSVSIDKEVALKVIDVSPLYRYHNSEGGYIEIGPQISLLSGVNENQNGNVRDVTEKFNHTYISGVFGFGSNFIQANAFTLAAGLRLSYSFTDLISDDGGNGMQTSYPLNDIKYHKSYNSYAPTKAISAMLHMEFNFDLGYFVRSNCNRHRVSFLTF